jgi:hypothetical protein
VPDKHHKDVRRPVHERRTRLPDEDYELHTKRAVVSDETRQPELYSKRTRLPNQARQRDLRRPGLHLEWAELPDHSARHLQRPELSDHSGGNLLRADLFNFPGNHLRRAEMRDCKSKRYLRTDRMHASRAELPDLAWPGGLYVQRNPLPNCSGPRNLSRAKLHKQRPPLPDQERSGLPLPNRSRQDVRSTLSPAVMLTARQGIFAESIEALCS